MPKSLFFSRSSLMESMMAGVSYSPQNSKANPFLLEPDRSQVFQLAEVADFVVSIIVYGILLAYFLRSTRRVLLYFLLSGTPGAVAQALNTIQSSLNTSGYGENLERQNPNPSTAHDVKTWLFFAFFAMIFLVGIKKRSTITIISAFSIAASPKLYARMLSATPPFSSSGMKRTFVRTKLFSTAAITTKLNSWALYVLIPALILMARIKSPWFKPLSAAVVLAIPLLIVQQSAITDTYWYIFTNLVTTAYCAFLYVHFFVAISHHPRIRPVMSGFFGLGVLPFVFGDSVGTGKRQGFERGQEMYAVGMRLAGTGSKAPIGLWVLAGVSVLWIAVLGVLVLQVKHLMGLRIA